MRESAERLKISLTNLQLWICHDKIKIITNQGTWIPARLVDSIEDCTYTESWNHIRLDRRGRPIQL